MKKYLALALTALSLASFTGCSKEPAQPESNAENTEETNTNAEGSSTETYGSLADWYTANSIDFSEEEESLASTIDGYDITIAVEGDTLIYRYSSKEQLNLEDVAVVEEMTTVFDAYCEENADTLADFKAQVIESSGVETTKAHIEVMNADGEGLIYFAEI